MAPPNTMLSDRAWLARRYSQDRAPMIDIAAEAACDVATVHRALARHKIPRRGAAGRRALAGVKDRTVRAEVRRAATVTDAARALGVDLATLVERQARMGDRGWYGGSDGAEEMAAEYLVGASLAGIAAGHGVSTRTVRRRLAAAGVEMRPVGRPQGQQPAGAGGAHG